MMEEQAKREERAKLEQRAKQGDQEALKALLRWDEPWIRKLVRQTAGRAIRNQRISSEDLIQDAREGWLMAWRRYDPQRGIPFQSFAFHYVQAAVIRALARGLGLDDRARRAFREVIRAIDRLASRGVQSPQPDEIIQEIRQANPQTRITEEDVKAVLWALRRPLSIRPGGPQEPDEEETPAILDEIIEATPGPEEETEFADEWDAIRRALGEEGWKFVALCILHEKAGFGRTWEEICALLCNRNPNPQWKQDWQEIISYCYYSALGCFPGLNEWDEVIRRFQQPPPGLTPDALKQWYRRMREKLQKH